MFLFLWLLSFQLKLFFLFFVLILKRRFCFVSFLQLLLFLSLLGGCMLVHLLLPQAVCYISGLFVSVYFFNYAYLLSSSVTLLTCHAES